MLPCHLLAPFYQGTKAEVNLKNNTEVQVHYRQVAQQRDKLSSFQLTNCADTTYDIY